jgi:acyl-CoA reductase-like NAD-dependent aldehyde dehydrogenase
MLILACYRLQALIRENMDDIAQSIVLEQGKTFGDAKGDVLRGLQVVEAMCGVPSLLLADKIEVARDMDTEVRKAPLGVGASICPFNFPGAVSVNFLSQRAGIDVVCNPAMIPLWSFVAIAAGAFYQFIRLAQDSRVRFF